MTARGAIRLVVPSGAGDCILHYTPPLDAALVLRNAPAHHAPAMVRRLYAICADAQEHAALLAVEAALGIEAAPEELARREIATAREAVREHGLRISLDWARMLGEPADHAAARDVLRVSQDGSPEQIDAAIERHVTGLAPRDWLGLATGLELRDWAAAGASVAARFIARVGSSPDMGAGIGALPERNGDHPLLATGLPGGSLLSRHAARLVGLCRLPARMAALAAGQAEPARGTSPAPGTGQAMVDCARGSLKHHLRVVDSRIAAYRIVSPTDRAFSAGGEAERQFRRVANVPATMRPQVAEWTMQALDPCVDYAIEVA
ncbi:MAG: hypothetical protein WC692_10230 [Erythrobacter sp.]|jgi:coenzyme F420-reducing hydrogenase alpha subunit